MNCQFKIMRGIYYDEYCNVAVNNANPSNNMCNFHTSVSDRLENKKQLLTYAIAIRPTQEESLCTYYKFPKDNYEDELEYYEDREEKYIEYADTEED